MNQNNLKSIGKLTPRKRRGVAEVISTLLLVVVTVVGAVILTSFLDETLVAGGTSVISSTDTTIKTIKLRAYDTRDGLELMGNPGINNEKDLELCMKKCSGSQDTTPALGGSEFLVIQIENTSVNPIFLRNLYLDNVNHPWDPNTVEKQLNISGSPADGKYPRDGRFSILPADITNPNPVQLDNQITGGKTVNLLVKLSTDPNIAPETIELSKTMRVQINIGENSLAGFLIESGDAR